MDVRQVVPRDAIPSIDDPTFAAAYDGDGDDPVLAVPGSPARAYPVRILDHHEIVNDDLAGPPPGTGDPEPSAATSDPVAVTWCPLCGSAVVYDRAVDGRSLSFGVSGKLADDDLVMYDRETESEWKQSTGRCIAGEYEGTVLSVRTAATMSWAGFREQYPDGVVLRPPGGRSEAAAGDDSPAPVAYDDDPYRAYREGDGFGLGAHRDADSGRDWDRDGLDPKTVVLGVERDGQALGVPAPRVSEAGGVVTATVGETDVVVFLADGELHAYTDPGYDWRPAGGGASGAGRFRGDGTVWEGATGRAHDGRSLDRLPARRLYAFTWQDDHGPDAFHDPT